MSTLSTSSRPALDIADGGEWRLDPARSNVEFSVPHFWGLVSVKGRFTRYQGILNLERRPAVQLTIEADSLDTGNRRRDRHLRSADFFDVANHPQVRFMSDTAALENGTLRVRGELHARGSRIELELDARIRTVDGEPQIEAETYALHRELGMTWSPLRMTRPYSKLVVNGRLVRADGRTHTA